MEQIKRICLILFPLWIAIFHPPASGQVEMSEPEHLFYEELPSIIIKSPQKNSIPSSVTIITRKDIELTPARNLLDLIEIYVPGALWMNHHEGPHPGIRGIISDRNYKVLLLVNGKLMNQKAHNGVTTEIEHWDLSDINKIEIIRGPGSVTYGSGAIMGVINIILHNSETAGNELGLKYYSEYDSLGFSYNNSIIEDNFRLYFHTSFQKTCGTEVENFAVDNDGNAGKLGKDFSSGMFSNPPHLYMRDYNEEPQIKGYIQIDLIKKLQLWIRYTSSGATLMQPWPQVKLDPEGDYYTLYQIRHRQLTCALRHEHDFTDSVSLKSLISYQSLDTDKGRFLPGGKSSDPENGSNKMQDFAENQLFTRFLLNYDFSEICKLAIGTELTREEWTHGWGNDENDLLLGDAPDIISGPNSEAIMIVGQNFYVGKDTIGTHVGDGWDMFSYSMFGELMVDYEDLTFLLSARMDKSEFSKKAFSPRLAIISYQQLGTFKFIIQESVRLNTATQLLQENLAGRKSDPEKLIGYEFVFESETFEGFQLDSSLYYYDMESIGWNAGTVSSVMLGDHKICGVEVELNYSVKNLTLGINHSYVKQIDWELRDGITGSGISYSDYKRVAGDGVVFLGEGNNLNNWANHATKMFININLSENITLHLDSHLFWKFDGAQDGMKMVEKAGTGTAREASINNAIKKAKDEKAYETDWRFNLSLKYELNDYIAFYFYGFNIFSTGNNKRYSYDAGVSSPAPHRIYFIEEPTVIGFKSTFRF